MPQQATVLAIGAEPGQSGGRVESLEPVPALQPSPFGSTVISGAYQWGPMGLASHSGEPDYKAMRGSSFPEDHAALMCEHFYEMALGAGTLYTMRLSDGNDRQSQLSVYCRDVAVDRTLLGETSIPTRAMLLTGAYNGRRGGLRLLAAGRKANLGASFSSAGTFDVSTDFTMQVNEFKGAYLKMDGVSRAYRVTGNNASGVLTIEVPPGDTGPGAVAGGWWLILDSPDAWNDQEGLAAKIDTASRNPTSEFDLTFYDQRNGSGLDPKYESVSLDATEDSDVEAKTLADFMNRSQYWMLATGDPDTAIGDFTADEMRPANLTTMPLPASQGATTRATGKLVTPAKASLVDGETFTIGDGRNAAVVFEFDTDGAYTSGNRQVDISAAVTADDVAAVMVTAINAAFSAGLLKAFAFQNGTAGGVTVLGLAGQIGNQTITETVANAGFTVTGFSGGTGPSNFVDVETFLWTMVGTGNPYPDPGAISYPTDSRYKMRAVCTFTAPTAFSVSYESWDGTFTIANSAALPAGALGTAYDPGGDLLPQFTLYAGSVAAVAGDVLTIYFSPLPTDVRKLGGVLYPHAHDQGFGSTNDIATFFRIVSNTVSRVTLNASTDLGTDHNVCYPGKPLLIAKAGNYTLVGGDTFIYDPGSGNVTLTQSLGAGAQTAAALAADLNTQEAAAHGDVPLMTFYATADNELVAEATYDTGESSSWQLKNGTLNTLLGLEDDTYAYGSEGSPIALSYAEALYGGRDGYGTLGEGTEYLDAFDTDTSPLNALSSLDVGCVKVALPGVSGTAGEPEQNRANEYCAAKGFAFRGEMDPTSATTETAAATYARNNLDGSRYRSLAWDSYGYPHRLPYRNQGITYVPTTGAILGVEARMARDEGGYHKAVAGPQASIGKLFKYLASMSGVVAEQAPRNEKILNPAGIQTMQQKGRLLYPNGDRNSDLNYVGTTWKHKVECLLHMTHQARYAADQLTWSGLGPEDRNIAANKLRRLFRPLWNEDWFVNEDGVDFLDGVVVDVGADVNPPEVQILGQLRAVITTLPLVGTAERVIIALGSGGVSALF